jgi:hypothetical protein
VCLGRLQVALHAERLHSMKINLRVELTDGSSQDVVCGAKDLVAFEEKYQRSVARFEQEMKLTDLLFLAWHSLNRQKITTKDFETWLDDVEAIEPSEQDPK